MKNLCGGHPSGLKVYPLTVKVAMENPTVTVKPLTRLEMLKTTRQILDACFEEAHLGYAEKYEHEIEVDFGDCKDNE